MDLVGTNFRPDDSTQPLWIDIAAFEKAKVFAALYNAASPLGYGFLHYCSEPMTVDEAAEVLLEREQQALPLYFDYFRGRALKIDLSSDEINPAGYDRANGRGVAQGVILTLFAGLDENNALIQQHHEAHTAAAAELALRAMDAEAARHTVTEANGIAVLHMSFDNSETLRPAVQRILDEYQRIHGGRSKETTSDPTD